MRPRTIRLCLWLLGIGTLVWAAGQSVSWVTAESAIREQLRYEYDSPIYRALIAELRGQAEWRALLALFYAVVLCGLALVVGARTATPKERRNHQENITGDRGYGP